MSECHDCRYHFHVSVFMLPLFASSSSSEQGQHSQDAPSLQFFEKMPVFVGRVGSVFSDVVVHLHVYSYQPTQESFQHTLCFSIGRVYLGGAGMQGGREGRFKEKSLSGSSLKWKQ